MILESKVEPYEIISNNKIATGIYKLELALPSNSPQPKPGQFVNLYLNDESLLLPRPISICDWQDGVLTLIYAVVGEGTKIFSTYGAGVKIRCSTPLGNGFTVTNSPAIVVGGGVGVPPLLFLSKQLSNVQAVLGFKSEAILQNDFPCKVELATDDGSAGLKGNVLDLLIQMEIPDGTQIYACGPKPMLKALSDFAAKRSLAIQVSLEERMGCGYGACVGCTCKTINGNKKVCEDGPVFNGSEVFYNE